MVSHAKELIIRMAKGPPRISTQRDCRFDHLIAQAIGKGFGVVLVYSGIETLDRAHEIRRGLFRCARHRGISADAGPSRVVDDPQAMGVHATGGGFELRFRVWSKNTARARHVRTYGTDRAHWPYDPRRAKNDEDVAAWAAQGLDEKGHKVK